MYSQVFWNTIAVVAVIATSEAIDDHPPVSLQFSCEMHVAEGFGHDGDGCILARASVVSSPIVSKVWFDAVGQRIAQTNPNFESVDPTPNDTFVGLYKRVPPIELKVVALTGNKNKYSCESDTLSPTYCANGSKVCPPSFGKWGELFTPFTGVLGDYYLNTSLIDSTPTADVWQWSKTTPTLMPNGTFINVTRNYTYHISKTHRAPDGTRPILRFQWTQSIPLQPVMPLHRDCFIFDYSTSYITGPTVSPPWGWDSPKGVTCPPVKGEKRSSIDALPPNTPK